MLNREGTAAGFGCNLAEVVVETREIWGSDGAGQTMRIPFALLLLASIAWPASKFVSLRVVPVQATLQGAVRAASWPYTARSDDCLR